MTLFIPAEADVTDLVRREIGACEPDGNFCTHHSSVVRITDNTCQYFWLVHEIALDAYSKGRDHLAARIAAMLRWLSDEGHVTPVGARQITKILEDEQNHAG